MPYLIGLLSIVVTVLVLLSRLANAGFDLGRLNPFLWRRRRAWRQKFEGNPLFTLEEPMAVAAVFAVATAKADGDMSVEQKRILLESFEQTFRLSAQSSVDLLASSSHLVGDGQILREQVKDVVARSRQHFTDGQTHSTLSLLEKIAAVEGVTNRQRELIDKVQAALEDHDNETMWG